MTFDRTIPRFFVSLVITASACFDAGEGNDEIAATETTSTTDSTDSTGAETTESTTESDSDGTSESDTTTGSDPFVFASDPPESYARVDRMGMPAIATVLISSKDAYNMDPTIEDPQGVFFLEVSDSVIALHAAFNDDLMAVGLTPCFNSDCHFNQMFDLIYPDTLKLDLTSQPGFPNGRRLSDPVIDLTLAVVLLDLEVHNVDTFADLPLNPPANDVTFSPVFPFLAAPH